MPQRQQIIICQALHAARVYWKGPTLKYLTLLHLPTVLILLISPGAVVAQTYQTDEISPPEPGNVYLQDRTPQRLPGLRDELVPPDRDPYAREPERYWREDRFRGPANFLSAQGDEEWA